MANRLTNNDPPDSYKRAQCAQESSTNRGESMAHTTYQRFPATHWSLVRRAGVPSAEARKDALSTLLSQYAPALRSFLGVVRKMPADEADELLQAFIADGLLEHELLRHAQEGRGKFRSLLLKCLNNFAVSRFRAQRVRSTLPLRDEHYRSESSVDATVEAAWARALVNQVVQTMRTECRQRKRLDIWTVFEGRILAEVYGDRELISYETLAHRLQLSSPLHAANLLVTAKRTYARLMRDAIAQYEPLETDVQTEICELQRILASAPCI